MIEAFERLSLTSTQYYTQISTSQFSQRLLENPPFKRLDSVAITNFKSFKDKVYVGPFLEFTSVVGPNGAGKSNVLDALMFCFCNEKSKLTFFDRREFITREGSETYKEMIMRNKYCQVEAKFLLENGRYFTISRTLYPDERQLFQIDGDEYSQKIYENFLMKNNINFVTSNFAIWQGEIDKLLLKSPKELTNYIETISGSTFFKKQQEDLQNEIKDVEAHIDNRSLKLSKLRQEKKQLRSFNHEKNSTLQKQKEYEEIVKQIVLVKSYLSELNLKDSEKHIETVEKKESEKCKQINETKTELQKQHLRKGELENTIKSYMKSISENYSKLKSMEQLNNFIDVQTSSQLEKQIHSLRQYCDNLIFKRSEIERQLNNKTSNDISKQYLELYNRWESQNVAINKELKKRKEEYLYTQGILQSKKNILEEFNQKQVKLEDLIKEQTFKKDEVEKNIHEVTQKIANMKVEESKNIANFNKNRSKMQEIQNKIETTNEKILDLESIVAESMQSQKDKEIIFKLNTIEGFKGLLSDWVKPSNKKYEVCFQMMMSSVLKYILCLDESASKQITVKLKENYQIRNLVILSNVIEKKQLITRANLGKLGSLAIDAIDYSKNLSNFDLFLKEYLNGKVICEDLQGAWKLLSQNIRGIKEIYTLDGNVLRHDGVVSSNGSIEFVKNKYKYTDTHRNNSTIMQDIQKFLKEKAHYEEELLNLKKKINDETMLKHTIEMQRLEGKKEQFILKANHLKKSIQSKKEVKSPKGLERQIEELENRGNKLSKGVEQIEKEMLKSKIFSQFCNKNKIDGLSNFRSVEDLSSLEDNIKQRSKLLKQLQEYESQIEKVSHQMRNKEEKFERLNEKVKDVQDAGNKQDVKRTLKNQEQNLALARNQLAKMKNINIQSLKFKSEIPQLLAQHEFMKKKHQKMVKEEMEIYGLADFPDSDYHFLEERAGIQLRRASREVISNIVVELQNEKDELEVQLENKNIGLTDIRSQFTDEKTLEEEIQRMIDQIKEADGRKNEMNDQLIKLKENRKAVFMNFMNELKPTLQQAYEILTKKDNTSGRVDIYIENTAFPCDEGLYYNPVPPTKRFIYDLDQLSGGEKSIASLALQYAIAVTSKSPFLILDETDAFLDAQNTRRFISLIQKTLGDRKLQFIVITHKQNLFKRGESLVGLTKFAMDPYSKAFSMRMNEPSRVQNVHDD